MRKWKSPEIVRSRALGPQDLETSLTPAQALAEIERALETSELITTPEPDPPHDLRRLTKGEIEALERRGCYAEDWGRIEVTEDFDVARVQNCRFMGDVRIGRFEGLTEIKPGASLPTGLYDSIIANCIIEDEALVLRVGLLANYRVGRRAVVRECATVICSPGATFGNGVEISVGIETGGREVRSYAELSVPVAECVAKRRADREFLADYEELVHSYVKAVTRDRGIIGAGAIVASTQHVESSFVGKGAVIENARSVVNSTILSASDEPSRITDGSMVKDSIIQWGCEVASMSIVDTSVLTEHSHIERHGKVTQSILGPNCAVGEGEVTACLVGPFVACHHQALLIASLWAEGKGNVAYGANVGSNHTSRAPDQELWPGEGIFFGLGCDIKFPSNFTRAPYTVIASGVTTLPQRVTMPFSLINPPALSVETISPSFNEIMPGWMLYANQYALARNQFKFRQRNKARRSIFNLEILRPDIVDLMDLARSELESAEGRQIYTAKQTPGIGKNYMTEQSRLKAIEAYTTYIRYWVLMELKRRLVELRAEGTSLPHSMAEAVEIPCGGTDWPYACILLREEMPDMTVAEGLRLLTEIEDWIAAGVLDSRDKDGTRGALTIPGYADAHPPALEDPVVKQALAQARSLKAEVCDLLASL